MDLSPPLSERYRVLKLLGGGGQAQVVLAEDLRTGGRVALKLVRTQGEAALEARFWREARALSRLGHPNLVRFLDAFPEHDPPVLAMEAIEGESLSERLARVGALNRDEVRALGVGIAAALTCLHDQGIAHRDVKPENILLAEGRGPVLVDLGLIRDDAAEKLTRTGALLGTPAYLPPEVFRLERGGPPGDVFALGVVLFECLARDRPYSYIELVSTGRGRPLPGGPRERLAAMFGRTVGAALADDAAQRPDAAGLGEALAAGTPQDTLDRIQRSLVWSASDSRPLPAAPAPPRSRPVAARVPARPGGFAGPPPAARLWRRRALRAGLGLLLLAGAMGAALTWLWPRPARPMPSLVLETTPFELEVSWDGADGGPDAELVMGARRLGLPAGEGRRSATLPLEGATRIQVLRAGEPVPFGSAGTRELEVRAAALPPRGALVLAQGPEGLEFRLPDSGWTPDRLRLRQGAQTWTTPARSRPQDPRPQVTYLVGRPLDGDQLLEVEALGQVQGGSYQRVGPGSWLERKLAPEVLAFEPDEGRLASGPYLPTVQAPTPRAVETGLPYDPGASAFHLRTVAALHPGLVQAPYRGKPYWWGVLTDSAGTWIKGVPETPGAPHLLWPLPRGASPGGAGLSPLEGALGLLTKISKQRSDRRFTWRVLAPGGDEVAATPAESLLEAGFVPITGGLPLRGGGALFLSEHLRTLVADARGQLLPPTGHPAARPFRPRPGASRVRGRYQALSGRWGPAPAEGETEESPDRGLVVIDLEARDVLATVRGLPDEGPSHPAVIAEGAARGLVLLQGRELLRIDLDALAARGGDPRRPQDLAELEGAGVASRTRTLESLDVRAADPMGYARSEVAVDGPEAALVALDTEQPPGGEASTRLRRLGATLRRWTMLLLGPAGTRRIALDQGPFPQAGLSYHQAMVELDRDRGMVATLVEGADDRWSLELHHLASASTMVRWSLRPRRGVRSPTLTPRGLMVATHKEVLIYPYPASE